MVGVGCPGFSLPPLMSWRIIAASRRYARWSVNSGSLEATVLASLNPMLPTIVVYIAYSIWDLGRRQGSLETLRPTPSLQLHRLVASQGTRVRAVPCGYTATRRKPLP